MFTGAPFRVVTPTPATSMDVYLSTASPWRCSEIPKGGECEGGNGFLESLKPDKSLSFLLLKAVFQLLFYLLAIHLSRDASNAAWHSPYCVTARESSLGGRTWPMARKTQHPWSLRGPLLVLLLPAGLGVFYAAFSDCFCFETTFIDTSTVWGCCFY